MSNDYYNILGITKTATNDEIKKAYRKQAMKYHPDRNKGDINSEKKFKEINEAYSVLSDDTKRKQYDTFGSSTGNPFSGGGSTSSYSSSGFEDLFGSSFGGGGSSYSTGGINIEDLFGNFGGGGSSSTRRKTKVKTEPVSLDFDKIYEVPVFDLILGCSIEVKGVYGTMAKLKIPPLTKSGTKFRVKGFGKKEGIKEGNLIVTIEELMPKNISDVDRSMLERIRENVGY